MKMKERFHNPTFVAAFVAVIVAFVYQMFGLFEVVSPISQEEVIRFAGLLINLLAIGGVLIDPTTPGITDK